MKRKQLIIIGIVLLIIITISVAGIILNNTRQTNGLKIGETLNVVNPLEYLVFDEDDNYYLTKVNSDITFEVKTEDEKIKYIVVDSDNNEFSTQVTKKEENIFEIAPIEKYTSGETYKLTIENAEFVAEELKDIKVITFTIVRSNSNIQELKKDVKKVTDNVITNVVENEDNYVLTSTKEYKENDIIYIESSNRHHSVYKVISVEQIDNAFKLTATVPQLTEAYDKLDVYGEHTLDILEFIPEETLKQYIEVEVSKGLLDEILDVIYPSVYAADLLDITISSKDGWLKTVFKIDLTADNPLPGMDTRNFKNHSFIVELELETQIIAKWDVSFGRDDLGITMKVKSDYNIAVQYENDILDEQDKSNKLEEVKKIIDNTKKDSLEFNPTLGKLIIPTPVAGLTVDLTLDYLSSLEVLVKASMEQKCTASATFGCIVDVRNAYVPKIYGNSDFKASEPQVELLGKIDLELGFKNKLELSFINFIKLGGEYSIGFYVEGQANVKTNLAMDKATFDGKVTGGLFDKLNVTAKVEPNITKVTVKLRDEKHELFKIENNRTVVNNNINAQTNTLTNDPLANTNNSNNTPNNNHNNQPSGTTYTVKFYMADYSTKPPGEFILIQTQLIDNGAKINYNQLFNRAKDFLSPSYPGWTLTIVSLYEELDAYNGVGTKNFDPNTSVTSDMTLYGLPTLQK